MGSRGSTLQHFEAAGFKVQGPKRVVVGLNMFEGVFADLAEDPRGVVMALAKASGADKGGQVLFEFGARLNAALVEAVPDLFEDPPPASMPEDMPPPEGELPGGEPQTINADMMTAEPGGPGLYHLWHPKRGPGFGCVFQGPDGLMVTGYGENGEAKSTFPVTDASKAGLRFCRAAGLYGVPRITVVEGVG